MSAAALIAVLLSLVQPADTSVRYDRLIRNVYWSPQCADGRICWAVTIDQTGGQDLLQAPTDEYPEYHWQWWKMTKDVGPVVRDAGGGYRVVVHDRERRRITVYGDAYVTEHSTVDLEIEDRTVWPLEQRRGLP